MALIIPPGFGSVVLSHVRSGDPDPYAVTFGVDLGDAAGDFQLAANLIKGKWVEFDQIYDDQVTLDRVVLYVGQDGEPPTVYEDTGATVDGTGPGSYLPQNNACLVTKNTASSGRRNKGRFYLPYVLPEGSVDDLGVIESVHRAGVQNAMDGFLDDLNTAGVGFATPMVVLHGTGLSTPPAPTVVTSLVVEQVIATQRTRLRK